MPEFFILLFWEYGQRVLCSCCYFMWKWGTWEKPLDGHSPQAAVGFRDLPFSSPLEWDIYLKLNKFWGSGPSIPSLIPSLEEFLASVRREQDIFGM